MASEKKRAEEARLGAEAYDKALKFTRKTLTRWKPDWDQAGRFYRDALKHYKLTGDDERIIAISRESAVAHEELGQFHQCAADLELAASLMSKEGAKGDRKVAYDLFREASINYRKNSNSDKAAAMYVKAAEAIESEDQAMAMDALKEACAVFEDDQRGQFHDATFKKSISSCIKYGAIDEAIALLIRQNALIKDQSLMSTFSSDVYKNILCVVVLQCHQGQIDEARETLSQAENAGDKFASTEQADAANSLLEAFEEGDSEKLTETLKKSPFKYILNPIAVIARKLKMDSATSSKPRRPAAASGRGKPAREEEEEVDENDFT